jgi:zinc finger CCHC domain-containing protein 8
MAEDPGWHSRGQFQDAVITEFPIFIDEDGDPSNYHCSTSPPVYERCSPDILGAEIEEESSLNEGVSHCFNCGSTYHFVSSCPTPHNTELIALSRQMYNFFKQSRVTEPMTLSAAAEFKHQRYEWVDSFQPGHVRNPLLREALGLHDDDVCSNLPWLENMANWGYPSGWFSEQDPQEQVLQRIDGMFVETVDPGEGDLLLAIFGDDEVEMLDVSASPVRKVPRCEETEREQGPREYPVILDQARRVESGRSRRWATYPPTYFSSDLLPVYNGMRLPPIQPLTSSTFSSERHLLWERILHDADTDSTQTQRLVSQYIGKVPQHSSLSAPLPIAPPPPLPPLPPPAPTTNLEVDEARPGAHQAGTSGDGESDMEMSDSDS